MAPEIVASLLSLQWRCSSASNRKAALNGSMEAENETPVSAGSSSRGREQLAASSLRLLQWRVDKALFACLYGDGCEGKTRTPGNLLHKNIYITPRTRSGFALVTRDYHNTEDS